MCYATGEIPCMDECEDGCKLEPQLRILRDPKDKRYRLVTDVRRTDDGRLMTYSLARWPNGEPLDGGGFHTELSAERGLNELKKEYVPSSR